MKDYTQTLIVAINTRKAAKKNPSPGNLSRKAEAKADFKAEVNKRKDAKTVTVSLSREGGPEPWIAIIHGVISYRRDREILSPDKVEKDRLIYKLSGGYYELYERGIWSDAIVVYGKIQHYYQKSA